MKPFDYDNLILREKIFGLEILEDTVKVLAINQSREKFSVIGFGKEKIDAATVSDGVILNKEAVADAIKKATENAKPKRIKQKYAGVALPDSKIFIRIVKFPSEMNKEEIREAIEWKAKDLIAMSLDKVYWDWHRLETKAKTQEVEVVISAIEKDCVDSYTQTLQLINIIPIYYDISGNVAARFLFPNEYHTKKALLVRINKLSTTLSLFLNGGVRYQTIIKGKNKIGGGYSTIVNDIAVKLNINKDKAKKLILSEEKLSEEKEQILNKVLEPTLNSLWDEIEQIVEYYSEQLETLKKGTKDANFAGIYLYGEGAKICGIKQLFEQKSFKISTVPPKTVSLSPMLPFISKQSLPENLVLLGLSLRNLIPFRDLRDINLVPQGIKLKYLQVSIYNNLYKYLRTIFWNTLLISVVLTYLLLIALVYKANALKEVESLYNIVESENNCQLREEILHVGQTASQIEFLLDSQTDWDKFFQTISNIKGEKIQYQNILISENPEAWKAISGKKKTFNRTDVFYLVINGTASEREDLQKYMQDMESSEIFEEVRMPISNFETRKNIEFSIYCLVDMHKL